MLRSLLLALVQLYRRRLSCRGPFAGVRCTFEKQESCCAFALRTLEDTPSGAAALTRIVRRLGRCRQLSLYRLADGSVGWGSGFDQVVAAPALDCALDRLDRELAADGECPSVRCAVRQAAMLASAAASAHPHASYAWVATDLPLIRDATAVRRALGRRFTTRCALGTALALAMPVSGPVLGMSLGVACTLALASAWSAWTLRRRLSGLEVLAELDGPNAEDAVRFVRSIGTQATEQA
jgi:hypothetical protein